VSSGDDLITVELLNFPAQVFAAARQHYDELMREFALLALSQSQERVRHTVPIELIALIETLGVRYVGMGDFIDTRRDEAIARGDLAIDVTYEVPASIGTAMGELDALLIQADAFCREGQMLTLASSAVERRFREWFLREFVRQAAGQPPTSWPGPMHPDA
jgi:hypothetical protein